MTNLKNYFNDGADNQAQATLCLLKDIVGSVHLAKIKVSRWENCREQGYVVVTSCGYEQLNIAFFEHRNSDSIHAVKWKQRTINTPTIENMDHPEYLKDKYNTDFNVDYGKCYEMAKWIKERLVEFWTENNK